MLECYVICWRNFNITYDCIESLLATASEPLEMTISNPNDSLPNSGTAKIREYLRDLVSKGRIRRALLFEENGFGWCLQKSIEDFRPQGPLFMMSDGDLIIKDGVDWVGLSRKYHEDHWVVTGCNLSTENYLPPNHGFSSADDNFGMWLQVHKTDWYFTHFGTQQNSIDSYIMNAARYTGGATKIREIEALHATWSIHYPESPYYDPIYATFKREQASNWVMKPKPLNMNYELVTL